MEEKAPPSRDTILQRDLGNSPSRSDPSHTGQTQSTPGRWKFLQEAVRFLVDGSARAYRNDLNDSF
jgi:hypothetical protein